MVGRDPKTGEGARSEEEGLEPERDLAVKQAGIDYDAAVRFAEDTMENNQRKAEYDIRALNPRSGRRRPNTKSGGVRLRKGTR